MNNISEAHSAEFIYPAIDLNNSFSRLNKAKEISEHLQKALQFANSKRISSYSKSNLLGRIAKSAEGIGDTEKAGVLLQQVLQHMSGMSLSADDEADLLSDIALSAARIGDAEIAEALINKISKALESNSLKHSFTMRSAAIAAAEIARRTKKEVFLERALEVAAKVEDPVNKAQLLSHIAFAAAEVGNVAQSSTLLQQALETTRTFKGNEREFRRNEVSPIHYAYGAIAKAAAATGDINLAHVVALLSNGDEEKARGLSLVLIAWTIRNNPAFANSDEDFEWRFISMWSG